jgi:hypothetical protein
MMVCSVAFACTIISLLEKTLCFLFKGGAEGSMSVSFVSAQNPLIKTYMFDVLPPLLKTPPLKNISVTLSLLKKVATRHMSVCAALLKYNWGK